MSTARRLSVFALVLVAAFGAGAGLGAVVGPLDVVGGDHQVDQSGDQSGDHRDGGHGEDMP